MTWYLKCMKNYATFSGRATRKEYWIFLLTYMLLMVGVAFAEYNIIGVQQGDEMPITVIFVVAHILPLMAAGVRRLHDTGKSGWWYLIVFVPFIGGFIFVILMIQESQKGYNIYGGDPRLPRKPTLRAISEDTLDCPRCAEPILIESIVKGINTCPACGSKFEME